MKRSYGQSGSFGKRVRTAVAAGAAAAAAGAVVARGRRAYSRMTIPRFRRGYGRTGGFYGRYPPMGDELKFLDTVMNAPIDTTPEVLATGQPCLIVQGATESNRIGRKCVVKSISIKGTLTFTPAAAATAAVSASIQVVWDKQANGSALTVTDVYTPNGSYLTDYRNMANSTRFQILKAFSWTFNSSAGVTTAYNPVRKWVNWSKKVNIPLEFSGATGAITEIKSNNICILGVSQGGDDLMTWNGTVRIRFSDT